MKTRYFIRTMIRYQDDFDNAVNAEWKAANPIPDIYPRYTNFTKLNEELEDLKIEMCKDNNNTLINRIYSLYMNQDEELTKEYINNKINKIFLCTSKIQLIQYLMSLVGNGQYVLCHVCHSGTERNPQFQVPHFSFGGLSLPDMSYYTDRVELKEPFLEMIRKQLNYLNVANDCGFIWDLESTLAKYHYTRAERREPLKTYHPTTMYEMKNKMKPYFDNINEVFPSEYHDIILNNHHILDGFKEVIQSYSLDDLKVWFSWKVIRSYSQYTTSKLYENNFDFYSRRLNGIKEPKCLEKRGATFVEGYLSDIFTKNYLDEHVDPLLKSNFSTFVETLRSALLVKIQNASWMDNKTRELAYDKLQSMTLKVVGPNKMREYNEIDKLYSSFLEFVDAYYKWDWDVLEVEEKMYKMRDPETWLMSSMTINAYYHPLYNEIVFPAGILQEPFYGVSQSVGENAGGIGAVIAHEMTHGFDDQGSQFDKNGFLHTWWSKETRENYENIIQNMEDHFNSIEFEGKPVNGKLTQGENLADLGGLQTALCICESEADKKDCLLSWARIWRANVRQEYAHQMLVVDPHSPPRLRINGILQHIGEFYRIFDVKEGDEMYLEPNKRCLLWSE